MDWIKGIRSELHQIEQVGAYKHAIKLSLRDYVPFEEVTNVDDEEESIVNSENEEVTLPDVEYLEIVIDGIADIKSIKQKLIDLQKEYDKSNEVNVFYINDIPCWLDSAARTSISRNCDIYEKNKIDTYVLYNGNMSFNIKVSELRNLLNRLELYAIETNKVTHNHINEIKEIKDKNGILNITKDYPNKLYFYLEVDE